MEISKNNGRKWTSRAFGALRLALLLACTFDVGCTAEGMAMMMSMLGAGAPSAQSATPSGGMLRPGSASSPSSSMPTRFDPLAASRSRPQAQVVSNGPVRRSPGGFEPVSEPPPQRHPSERSLFSDAPPADIGELGPATQFASRGNDGGGFSETPGGLGGDASFGSRM